MSDPDRAAPMRRRAYEQRGERGRHGIDEFGVAQPKLRASRFMPLEDEAGGGRGQNDAEAGAIAGLLARQVRRPEYVVCELAERDRGRGRRQRHQDDFGAIPVHGRRRGQQHGADEGEIAQQRQRRGADVDADASRWTGSKTRA